MKKVSIIFRRGHNIGSLALRSFLWSAWSHCGIIDGDDVIEAAAFHGVVRTPLKEFIEKASKYDVIDVMMLEEEADKVLAAARSQVGKGYDYGGIFGIVVRHRDWHSQDKWTCSELVAWSFEQAGYPLVRKDSWRVTPQDIYIPFYR